MAALANADILNYYLNEPSLLINALNGSVSSPHGLYSTDMDHDGALEPPDLLLLIDLLNGGGEFSSWQSSPISSSSCP